jgi:hypothetical protein
VDLQPGKHWVWASFAHLLKRLSCVVILSNQQAKGLENTGLLDSYLSSDQMMFPKAEGDKDEGSGSWNGCYLTYDPHRGIFIRPGMTVAKFAKRWKQHEAASRLNGTSEQWRWFYQLYPHQNCQKQLSSKRGTFQQLEQRIAVGIASSDQRKAVELFDWTASDETNLDGLTSSGSGCMIDKKFRHLSYMFETVYAVGLRQEDNITQNPGCEWQLELYGRNKGLR